MACSLHRADWRNPSSQTQGPLPIDSWHNESGEKKFAMGVDTVFQCGILTHAPKGATVGGTQTLLLSYRF